MVAISIARIHEEQLNHEVRRTRVAPRAAMLRPTTPSTTIQAPASKKLTRDELHERLTKELCWHCNKPWSYEHHCKKDRLLVIELVEDEDNETSEKPLNLKKSHGGRVPTGQLRNPKLALLLDEFADASTEPRGLPPNRQHDHRK
ncbi:hypothetical protein B296_00015899, partial [Ensete ventricosum]